MNYKNLLKILLLIVWICAIPFIESSPKVVQNLIGGAFFLIVGLQSVFYPEYIYNSRLKALQWQHKIDRYIPIVGELTKRYIADFEQHKSRNLLFNQGMGLLFATLGLAILLGALSSLIK